MRNVLRGWARRTSGLAVVVGILGTAGPAAAQIGTMPASQIGVLPTAGPVTPQLGCASGQCGAGGLGATGGCSTGTCGKSNCGLCGMKMYPMLEKRYIKQFCKPTICDGSCFGYYKTQWTPWQAACPNWCGEADMAAAAQFNWGPPPKNTQTVSTGLDGPVSRPAIPVAPTTPATPATPADPTKPSGTSPTLPAPRTVPGTGTDTTPPLTPPKKPLRTTPTPSPTPTPSEPAKPSTDQGLTLPAVPVVPIFAPAPAPADARGTEPPVNAAKF